MNNRYKKTKFYIFFSLTVAIFATISHLFIHKSQYVSFSAKEKTNTASTITATTSKPDDSSNGAKADSLVTENNLAGQYTDTLATTSPMTVVSDKVWSYDSCFYDCNYLHLRVAKVHGVKPMTNRSEVFKYVKANRLVNMSASPYYILDSLTHSVPYLVPKAQQLINTISINFIDSLISKGLKLHKPIITSVLRTSSDIKRLQQDNHNSVSNSAHQYGTTIDITYIRFMPFDGSTPTRFNEKLKMALAEVLFDLKEEDKCYVLFEHKQSCFHITVR